MTGVTVELSDFEDADIISRAREIGGDIGLDQEDLDFLIDFLVCSVFLVKRSDESRGIGDINTASRLDHIINTLRKGK